MKCSYCFGNLGDKAYTSTYLHMVISFNEKEFLPLFHNKECMCKYIAIRNNEDLEGIQKDFENYMK